MKKMIVASLTLCLSQASIAETLNCEKVGESTSDYFTQIEEDESLSNEYKEKLIRKSVAAFHYGTYSPKMTLNEVDELGENVSVSKVRGKNNEEFISVNVGFGGGNSANYYFEPGTLIFVPVSSEDGECIDQGQSEGFPFERNIEVVAQARLDCKFGKDSPFDEVSVKIPLGADGLLFKSEGTATFAGPNPILRRLKIKTPQARRVNISFFPNKELISFNIDVQANKGPTKWQVGVAARLSEKSGYLFGTAFPLVVGGRWGGQARDYHAKGICTGQIGITKVEYNRVIDF